MRCLGACLATTLLVVVLGCSSSSHRGGPCDTNADCDFDETCKKDDGDCNGTGTCVVRGEVCPLVWAPVCGCDGQTYGNDCEATTARTSVSAQGACP